MSDDYILEAQDLVKRFGEISAVKGVSFSIHRGESFGFLGPNGAGKTSTMRMISAVSQPSSGTLTIFGLDPRTQVPRFAGDSVWCPKKTHSNLNCRSAKT
jgi:lipooligosaccharide transport system ATP-binding protein